MLLHIDFQLEEAQKLVEPTTKLPNSSAWSYVTPLVGNQGPWQRWASHSPTAPYFAPPPLPGCGSSSNVPNTGGNSNQPSRNVSIGSDEIGYNGSNEEGEISEEEG
jgi:hypothetical protein